MNSVTFNPPTISSGTVTKGLVLLNVFLVLFYFSWWFTPGQQGNLVLFGLLFAGEVYHVIMILLFWFTVRRLDTAKTPALPVNMGYQPSVDVYVTVAGEPIEILTETIQKIQANTYQNKKIFILNDSFVAGKENWREYEVLAKKLGVTCITRKTPGGAKAGNINNALRKTTGELVAVFDTDMAPFDDFLSKTVPHFIDEKVAFVQTPQYYANADENLITSGAWEQQEFFFGPIMRGKADSNAAFICGTNVVIRRTALLEVGGMNETSIAEDFLTSLSIHQNGWKSIYVPEVLATGLAPEDLNSYYKQQLRWARGSVEVLFKHNPLFVRGLTWKQRLEYLSSTLYYCNGVVVLIDSLIPITFLLLGLSPIFSTTTVFALYFLPFMMSVIYSLHLISGKGLTLRAIAFTQASWFLQIQALLSAISGKKMGFAVTPKTAQSGNFIFLAYPHLAYIALAIVSSIWAINRDGLSPSVITNISWVLFNILLFVPFIVASVKWRKLLGEYVPSFKSRSVNPGSYD
ncbi:MAG: glycosyltransferase [bacterium]|nr:glycosyltransferase [bacterium]